MIKEEMIVEIKAVKSLIPAHEVQLVNYLTATGIDHGLLLNFGAQSLGFRRKRRILPQDKSAQFLQT
ncbi:MAG: GxxExxY protein [Verrucomicrobiales bacterium]